MILGWAIWIAFVAICALQVGKTVRDSTWSRSGRIWAWIAFGVFAGVASLALDWAAGHATGPN